MVDDQEEPDRDDEQRRKRRGRADSVAASRSVRRTRETRPAHC